MSDDDDFDQYLDDLTDKMRAELSDVVLQQAFMLSDAQRSALESLEATDETGALEASCTVSPGADDLEFIVQAGGDMTTKEVRDGSGIGFDYAEAFEYGTTHQHARPFFWPTYQSKKEQMIQAINDAVEKAIQ